MQLRRTNLGEYVGESILRCSEHGDLPGLQKPSEIGRRQAAMGLKAACPESFDTVACFATAPHYAVSLDLGSTI